MVTPAQAPPSSDLQDSKTKKVGGHQNTTLGSLLHYFVGIELSVECKTGRLFQGVLSAADEHMNLTLNDATQVILTERRQKKQQQSTSTSTDESTTLFKSLQIRGPSIRYIHFPDDLDLTGAIRLGVDRERAAKQRYQRGIRK